MNDFYLTLPSNTNTESETSNFTVRLPRKLDLNGKWEVALVEIQYPHSWNNIRPSQTENCIEVTFANKLTIQIHVPVGYYGTIHELLSAIEYGKQKAGDTITSVIKQRKPSKAKKFRKKLHVGHAKDVVFGFQLRFDETLKRVACKLFPAKIVSIKFSPRLQYMLGFESPTIRKSKQLAAFQPDLRGGFYSLYVYCNLVEPQIVGNVIAPLLRNVHIEGVHGDIVEKLYQSPHYVPVIAKEIDRIEIDIKDDKNQSVNFQFGKTVTKLHFRKKKSLL